MPSKMGRPKAENPKSFNVRTCLDFETVKRLDEYCVKHGTNRSDVLRKALDLLLASEK